jgi:hypothetical protein
MEMLPFGSVVSWWSFGTTKGERGNWLELIEGDGEKLTEIFLESL